jgi:hypothetical protein
MTSNDLNKFGRVFRAVGIIRHRGLRWLGRRIRREVWAPTTVLSRIVSIMVSPFVRAFLRRKGKARAGDVLYFFFDLEVLPITYDVVTYLAAAEMRRRSLNLASIHVVIVPGSVRGLRDESPDYAAAVDEDARRWRLHNLVIPIFRMLPSCTGYTLCSTRSDAFNIFMPNAENVYPEGYSVARPLAPQSREICDIARAGQTVLPMLRATPQAVAYIRRFLEARRQGRRVLVVNLRHYSYMPGRNSADENWFSFARGLDSTQWMPVFVMDTETALDPLPVELAEFVVCHAAPWNVELRMALYESADLTMSIGQGPMELCWFNHRCRYAVFLRPNASPESSDDAHRAHGFEIGKDLPYAIQGQRWIWASDDVPIIRSVFAEMTGIGNRTSN